MYDLFGISDPAGRVCPGGETGVFSFRHYVEGRKYDYGRGTAAAWAFIAFARGDPGFPDIASWTELRTYLEGNESGRGLVTAARSVWRSYTAYQCRIRKRTRDGFGIAAR